MLHQSIEQPNSRSCLLRPELVRACTHLAAAGIGGGQIADILGQDGVEHAEVDAHVAHALGADGAGVVVARVLPEAVRMHEVPARQLLHSTSQPQVLPLKLPRSPSVLAHPPKNTMRNVSAVESHSLLANQTSLLQLGRHVFPASCLHTNSHKVQHVGT